MNNCINEIENYEEETNKIIDILNAHIRLVKQKEEQIDALINENNQIIKENEELKNHKNLNESRKKSQIKAFKCFYNMNEFLSYTNELYSNIDNWMIRKNSNRLFSSTVGEYYTTIKEEFNEKNLTNKPIEPLQILSIIDTLKLMKTVINDLKNIEILNETKIIMEYVLPDTTKSRIDYLLSNRNNILLIEFSQSEKYDTLKEKHKEKTQQVIEYRNILDSYINNNKINIKTKVCIYLPEENKTNVDTNDKMIKDLEKVITNFFLSSETKNAFETLLEIEKENNKIKN